MNHGTIADTLSWYKILLLNGFSLIRVKRRLHMIRREVCENSWSRHTNLKLFKTDNSMELGKECEDLSWNHRTSTPHRSETNGIAESAVRRVKEGTSAVFLQSGLDERWWSDSMHGMLLLSAKCPRPPCRWENSLRKAIWRTIHRTNNSFWINGCIPSHFNARPIMISPI